MSRSRGNIPGGGGYYAVEMTGSERGWSAFEAEALPHLASLYRIAMWFERNRHEAEDLVQDTLEQALVSFHRYTPGTNCRAWLMSILHHVRSNRIRAKSRSPLVSDPDDRLASTVPFVPPVPEQLTDEDLLNALGRIPEHYQHVIVLSDVEELPYKDIAVALGIPIGTVMSRLHRGRAMLRQELTKGTGHSANPRVADSQRTSPI
jgi:RNA polymerase sigma-70 factor (ECF subfamily)